MDDFPGGRRDSTGRTPELPERLRPDLAERTAPAEADDAIDLRALFASVWRRKLTIAAFGFGFAIIAMAAVYSLTPRYTATAVVMLNQAEEQIVDVESVVTGLTPDFYSILAEVEVLRSRALAARVVEAANLDQDPYFNSSLRPEEDFGLVLNALAGAVELLKTTVRGAVTDDSKAPGRDLMDPDYWTRKEAVDTLLGSLTVSSVGDTYVYALTVETENPIQAANLANKIAELYILDQLETKFEATQAATEWLSNRVAQLKTELEASEAAVEAYNSSTTLISEASLGAMNRQLKELRERESELSNLRATLQTRLDRMRAGLAQNDWNQAADASNAPRLIPARESSDSAEGFPCGLISNSISRSGEMEGRWVGRSRSGTI